MDFFEYIEETQLPAKSFNSYNCLAFDGCDYYFLLTYQARIMKCNLCFEKTAGIPTQRKYSCMCYDFNSDCFWAASTKYCNKVFKLDKNLDEMDCLVLNEYQNIEKVITSISCNNYSDSLLVSFSDRVLKLNKMTGQCKEVLKKTSEEWITGIVSLSWGLIIVSFIEDKQYIRIVNGSGKTTKQHCIDHGYVIKNIISNSCNEDTDTVTLSMLAAKAGGYSYILKTTISSSNVDNTVCQSIANDNWMNLDTNNNNMSSSRIFNGNINKDSTCTPSCCNCCCHCHPCCVDGGIME